MARIRKVTEAGTVQYICSKCGDYHEFREDFGEHAFNENFIFCRRCGARNGTGTAPSLAALNPITRDQVEKMRGKWIDARYSSKDVPKCQCSICGKKYIGMETDFCQYCGAPMTCEAVDILWKRLEALRDVLQPAGMEIQRQEGEEVHCLRRIAQPKGRLGKTMARLRVVRQSGTGADGFGYRKAEICKARDSMRQRQEAGGRADRDGGSRMRKVNGTGSRTVISAATLGKAKLKDAEIVEEDGCYYLHVKYETESTESEEEIYEIEIPRIWFPIQHIIGVHFEDGLEIGTGDAKVDIGIGVMEAKGKPPITIKKRMKADRQDKAR